jgi:isochorismate synthase
LTCSFFFSGPTKTLLAEDEGTVLSGCTKEREALLADVARVFRDRGESSFLVGAVPFADDAPVRLFCPTRITQSGRWSVDSNVELPRPLSASRASGVYPSGSSLEQAAFVNDVRAAVEAIGRRELRKVVLARATDVQLPSAPDLQQVMRDLHAKNLHGFTYSLALPGALGREPRTLVGASPELLLSRRGTRVVSAPLAGSAPRSPDPREDQARARELLNSAKDRHEHKLVVQQILETLQRFAHHLRFEIEPVVTATHSMWHLSTRIEGTLRDPNVTALQLALALHPTPAVCGTPTRDARAFIERTERFDRGYFTGTLGYMDASGDGDWIVTIRCAELGASHARLFAGAGIVESSVPELELAETSAKMRTILDALGALGAA